MDVSPTPQAPESAEPFTQEIVRALRAENIAAGAPARWKITNVRKVGDRLHLDLPGTVSQRIEGRWATLSGGSAPRRTQLLRVDPDEGFVEIEDLTPCPEPGSVLTVEPPAPPSWLVSFWETQGPLRDAAQNWLRRVMKEGQEPPSPPLQIIRAPSGTEGTAQLCSRAAEILGSGHRTRVLCAAPGIRPAARLTELLESRIVPSRMGGIVRSGDRAFARAVVFDLFSDPPPADEAIGSWDLLVVDAAEGVSLVLLAALAIRAQEIVVAGDPMGRRPSCHLADPRGKALLGRSVFDLGLVSDFPVLREDHRRAPDLARCLGILFHGGGLEVPASSRTDLVRSGDRDRLLPGWSGRRLVVLTARRAHVHDPRMGGPVRTESVDLVREAVADLRASLSAEDLLVLTPFSSQRLLLRRAIEDLDIRVRTVADADGLEVHTVVFDPVCGQDPSLAGDDGVRLIHGGIAPARARLLVAMSPLDLENPILSAYADLADPSFRKFAEEERERSARVASGWTQLSVVLESPERIHERVGSYFQHEGEVVRILDVEGRTVHWAVVDSGRRGTSLLIRTAPPRPLPTSSAKPSASGRTVSTPRPAREPASTRTREDLVRALRARTAEVGGSYLWNGEVIRILSISSSRVVVRDSARKERILLRALLDGLAG